MRTAIAVVVGLAIAACGKTPSSTPLPDADRACEVACLPPPAGASPPADCATDLCPTICPNAGTCPIDEALCGSKSTCLPMSTNKGKDQLDFRIRRLSLLGPKALASGTIQTAVVDHGITLGAKQCGENGDGSFTWLLHVDKAAGTLTTGGSPPTSDPFGTGYCFASAQIAGNDVRPGTASITFTGDKFSSAAIAKLTVPIFVNNDVKQPILLPISDVAFKDVTISEGGDCIGKFNYAALDGQCFDSRSDCSRWLTAGALAGYITLEEADLVPVPQLGNKSLCVMLTGGSAGPDNKCIRVGGKIKDPGDYCSTTKSAGGCQDSFWLAATFAAAAVKIKPPSSDRLCDGSSGGSVGDAGTD